MKDKTLREIEDSCTYSRGDVLDSGPKRKLVVLERYVSIDLDIIEYKIQWEHTRTEDRLEEKRLERMDKVGERDHPYFWDYK